MIRLMFKKLGFKIRSLQYRPSIEFAKEYFKKRSITPACLEIGVDKGENLKYLNSKLRPKRLIGVDPYKEYSHFEGHFMTQDKVNFNKIDAEFTAADIDAELLIMTSDDFFKNNREVFDIIYIDGLHTYEQVYKDLENSWACLKHGGILAGHDMVVWDVMRAVHDFAQQKGIRFQLMDWDYWVVKE